MEAEEPRDGIDIVPIASSAFVHRSEEGVPATVDEWKKINGTASNAEGGSKDAPHGAWRVLPSVRVHSPLVRAYVLDLYLEPLFLFLSKVADLLNARVCRCNSPRPFHRAAMGAQDSPPLQRALQGCSTGAAPGEL